MAPKDLKFSNKFIVTSKIFVSQLPDSNTLIPDNLVSCSESDFPSTILLLDTPEDDSSWFKYIKVSKTAELFEEACSLYPKYWKVHYRHSLYYIYKKDTSKAFQVFNDALKELNDLDLHLKYLVFLYHTASIHEYISSLTDAIDKAGMDYRSDFLWKEWALILVKIYNCNLLALGMTSGLLPDVFSVDPNVQKTPLVPNETEQLIYRSANTMDPSNRTYLELYGELNSLRNLFHKWLKTPTNNMRSLWDAYSLFENTVDSTGTLSTKLLGDMKSVINLSMRAYEKITELYSKVYPIKPASYEGTMSSPENVAEALNYWMDIIKYEESNPLETTLENLIERVLFNFERSLCPMVYSREMWYRYFQFLLYTDRRDEAISKMSLALNRYLKEDEKLRFVLALYLEESGDVERAREEFANLVSPVFKTSEMDQDSKGNLKLRKLLECRDYLTYDKSDLDGMVHYLNFLRREMGPTQWREQVQMILSKSDLNSWDLYWYAASTELRCYKNYDKAVQILKEAQSKMAFSFKHTVMFFNTMLNVGKHNDVRILLSDLVTGSLDKSTKITDQDREGLWDFWMNMEYLYGSQEQFDHVKSLYSSAVISSKLSMDPFTEKSNLSSQLKVFALYSDIAEAFEKSGSTSKRKAAQDFGSIVQSRRKLFCCGIDFNHLDKIFKFSLFQDKEGSSQDKDQESSNLTKITTNGTKLNKETKVKLENGLDGTENGDSSGEVNGDTNDDGSVDTNDTVSEDSQEKNETEKDKEDSDKPPKKDSKRNRNKKSKSKVDKPKTESNDQNYTNTSTTQQDESLIGSKFGTKICRPNVSKLSEIEPKMTTSLESLVQLHGSKRPILPPKFRPLDSTSTPCKALFDFIRILPSSKDNKFSNLYVNTESVDYLIRTVENMDLENIEIEEYEPLPTNLSAQLKQTDETLNEKSFQFNQGLENILRFLQDNALFDDDKPTKRQKIAI